MNWFLAINPRPPVMVKDMLPTLLALPATVVALLVLPRIIDWLMARLESHRRTEDPLCRQCGYVTRGLPSSICPECGSDLKVVGTTWDRPRRRRDLRTIHRAIMLMIWSGAIVFCCVRLAKPMDEWLEGRLFYWRDCWETYWLMGGVEGCSALEWENHEIGTLRLKTWIDGPMMYPRVEKIAIENVTPLPPDVFGKPVGRRAGTVEIELPSRKWVAHDADGVETRGDWFDLKALRRWLVSIAPRRDPDRALFVVSEWLRWRMRDWEVNDFPVHRSGDPAVLCAGWIAKTRGDASPSVAYYPYLREAPARILIFFIFWLLGLAVMGWIYRRTARRQTRVAKEPAGIPVTLDRNRTTDAGLPR